MVKYGIEKWLSKCYKSSCLSLILDILEHQNQFSERKKDD